MTDRELMQMALDALEAMQSYARAEKKGLRICDESIEALRERLAQPEWVGLTDEEIEECKINGGLPHAINWRLSVKVMEAKLKEKNT